MPSRRPRLFAAALLAAACSVTLPAAPPKHASEPETPYLRIAKLASFLSDGEAQGALEAFDRNMPRYAAIAEDLQALAAQTEVLCAISVIADREEGDDAAAVHHLDLDWYMTLKSRGDSALAESRRQRVAVTMQRFAAKSGAVVWRITALSPETILAPITVR